MLMMCSRLAQDIYTVRHEREMSTVKEIHAMLQAHVQLLDQVYLSTVVFHWKSKKYFICC